ncbi:MAG TPA: hypothetical protein VF092_08240 [Longimicrobium sp.]
MTRPATIPLTSLADAASIGVDIALQERANASDPSMEPIIIGAPIPPPNA